MSDVMGKASRMILHALVDGETDPAALATLALGRVRAEQQTLEAALAGHVDDHHRFLLGEYLRQIEHLEQAVERVTAEIARRFAPPPPDHGGSSDPHTEDRSETAEDPLQTSASSQGTPLSWAEAMTLLCSIPRISERSAYGIIAEIGIRMQQFPTAAHLASWAGVCPGNHESAGKRLSEKPAKGTRGYDASCSKPLMRQPTKKIVIWRHSFAVLPLDVGESVPRWLLLTAFW